MKKKIVSLLLILAMTICLLPNVALAGPAYPPSYKLYLYPGRSDATISGATKGNIKIKNADPYSLYYTRAIGSDVASCFGYTFLGWYLTSVGKADGSNKITSSSKITSTLSYAYAHWGKKPDNRTIAQSGGSFTVNPSVTSNHSWRVVSYDSLVNTGNTSWIRVTGTGNSVSFSISPNTNNLNRSARIWIADQYGNSLYFTLTQIGLIDYINNQFAASQNVVNTYVKMKWLNTCPYDYNGKKQYDMRYAGWFVRWRNDLQTYQGCCTCSAMMDLLNRRLARDGKLSTNYYFDIRDAVQGLDVNSNTVGPEQYRNTYASTSYTNGEPAICGAYWAPELYNIPNGRGAERVNKDAEYSSATFTNTWGDVSSTYVGHHTTYSVTIERGVITAAYIRQLLASHPEGIFVYSKKPDGNDHAVVLVPGKTAGEIQIIDNGDSSRYGPQSANQRDSFNDYAVSLQNGITECDGFCASIFAIAYINN